MVWLRDLAKCLGLAGTFSVVGDFFGYASAPPWNLAPSQTNPNLPQSVSLLTQMRRVRQYHFHLNIVRVGTNANGFLPQVDEQNVDCAVHVTRDIFAAAGIGIGRVQRGWHIELSENTGYDVIGDDCEAEDLVDEYSVANDGIDCFLVPLYDGDVGGYAPSGGDGVVVESREGDFFGTARTMAHELGHYLGLGHENGDPNNLMCQTKVVQAFMMLGAFGLNSLADATAITEDQVQHMMDYELWRLSLGQDPTFKGPC